jgi:soluble lytic murein transglycosylase-like protein
MVPSSSVQKVEGKVLTVNTDHKETEVPIRSLSIEAPVRVIESQETEEPEPDKVKPVKSKEEIINDQVIEICKLYNMEPELIESIIFYESRYDPKATNGNCVGLMQVSMYWHSDRAKKLGVTDFYDTYSNILLGVDFISELFKSNDDPALVLMLYNMKRSTAMNLYNSGNISDYAIKILERTKELKEGGAVANAET